VKKISTFIESDKRVWEDFFCVWRVEGDWEKSWEIFSLFFESLKRFDLISKFLECFEGDWKKKKMDFWWGMNLRLGYRMNFPLKTRWMTSETL
jgi:hypothetical protein